MRSDPLQLACEHANDLRALRNFDLQELLNRHHVSEIVPERIEIIHSIGDDDALLVLAILEQLLHAGVKITDVRRRLDDRLAVKNEFKAQHAVRRGMLRSHRDRHLGVERLIDDLELRWDLYCAAHMSHTSYGTHETHGTHGTYSRLYGSYPRR